MATTALIRNMVPQFSPGTMLRVLLQTLLMVDICNFVRGVKCFCDRDSCDHELICSADWCLVGFKKGGPNSVAQMCSDENIIGYDKCAMEWNGWSEVCICDTNFCNTFANLRGDMATYKANQRSGGPYEHRPDGFEFNKQLTGGGGGGYDNVNSDSAYRDDGDGPYSGTVHDIDERRQNHAEYRPRYRSSNLIILLVVIPLTVGGLAVCLIFINYHCKMC